MADLLALFAGVSHASGKQTNSTNSVIIAGNDVIDVVGIAVGINNRHHRNTQLTGFFYGNGLFFRVDNENSAGELGHVLDAAEALFKFGPLPLQTENFFFDQQVVCSVLGHDFNLLQTIDTALDGAEVGQHTAEPTVVNIVLTCPLGLFTNGVLSLFFGADEQYFVAVLNGITQKAVSLFEIAYSLLQIDNIDAVTSAKNIRLHFRVPAFGLVTEVNPGFKQLLHGDL